MKIIKRKCVICGEIITVKVYDDGRYEGGHYFGIMHVPKYLVEDGYKQHPNYRGEDSEEVYFEWWECNHCYGAWDKGGR